MIGVLLATLLGLAVAQTADALDTGPRGTSGTRPRSRRPSPVRSALLARDGGQLVFTSESFVGNWYQQGVVLAFEHDGFDVRVPSDVAEVYGRHRVRDDGRVQADLLVLANAEIAGFTGRPGYHVLGFGAAAVAAGHRPGRCPHRRRAPAGCIEARAEGRVSAEEFRRRADALPEGPERGADPRT